MGEFTFIVEKPCPVCGKSTRVIKPKSRLVVEKTDEDYCVHYKGFNPYFYRIWFCEHCGFAADEKHFLANMAARDKKKIQEFLEGRKLGMKFTEERGVPEAVASFKLAIFYQELIKGSLCHRAGLSLALAWVYRDAGEEDNEREMLQKAANLYAESLVTEHYPVDKMSDTMALYLVGAIYFRMGDYDQSTQYLSRIIGDKNARTQEVKLFEKARDLWQDIRDKQGGDGEAKK